MIPDYDMAVHASRVVAGGGIVPNNTTTGRNIQWLKENNMWNDCVFYFDPTNGIIKDGNSLTSKGFDLKSNADLVQATGAAQPTYNAAGYLTCSDGFLKSGLLSVGNPVRTNSAITAVCWANRTHTVSSLGYFFNRHLATKIAWIMSNGAAGAYNKYRVNYTTDGTNTTKSYISNDDIFDSTWKMLGFTFGSGVLKLYVNGAEMAVTKTIDDAGDIYDTNTALKLGANDLGTSAMSGSLGTAIIFNTVKSAAELLALYNNTKALYV